MSNFNFDPLAASFVPAPKKHLFFQYQADAADFYPGQQHQPRRRWAGIEDLPTNISARILQHIAGEASDPMDPSFFSARAGVDRAVKALSAVMAIPALREAASEIGIEDPIGWIKYDLDLNIFCYKEYKRWSFYWWYNPSKETSG